MPSFHRHNCDNAHTITYSVTVPCRTGRKLYRRNLMHIVTKRCRAGPECWCWVPLRQELETYADCVVVQQQQFAYWLATKKEVIGSKNAIGYIRLRNYLVLFCDKFSFFFVRVKALSRKSHAYYKKQCRAGLECWCWVSPQINADCGTITAIRILIINELQSGRKHAIWDILFLLFF